MARAGKTIEEATREWVSEMNAIPHSIISALMKNDIDDWHEVTTPSVGDRVYFYGDIEGNGDGEIVEIASEENETVYKIELDCGRTVEDVNNGEFEVERDDYLPMWGWLWSFVDSADYYWFEDDDGIQIMSECGFRIYESEEFGYFFGIDGAGYDFYEAHWIPLYKKRGLQWHDPMTESGSFVMTEDRKAVLYSGLLNYLEDLITDRSDLVKVLRKIGFSKKEIAFEGLEVIE